MLGEGKGEQGGEVRVKEAVGDKGRVKGDHDTRGRRGGNVEGN